MDGEMNTDTQHNRNRQSADQFADRIVPAAVYADPIEADAAANFLNKNGVHAKVVGDFTSNFQVEIASEIQVVVTLPQLAQAQSLLEKLENDQGVVDWSKVDVGDPTPPELDESGLTANPKGPTQFNLQTLIGIQTFIALAAAGLAAWLRLGLDLMEVIYFGVGCACLFGIATATIGMARGMHKDTGKRLIVAAALFYFACGVIYLVVNACLWGMKALAL